MELRLYNTLTRSEEAFTPIDAAGRRVWRQPLAPGSTSAGLDLPDLPAGVYWLKVEGGRSLVSRRFVRF